MNYQQMMNENDADIPYLVSIFKLPEISCYISIDEQNYWKYVTTSENVHFFKVYENDVLVATAHLEVVDRVLYLDIMVVPEYQGKGIATTVLKDIQAGKLVTGFERMEVSIDESNVASIRLFEKMGFVYVSKEEELINYVYEVKEEA
ncbi:MAG: GNAT family N-acetyltransferase [Lachnospiraceae bacterium]|nr:GNAT family N-acetyltransferase [Lachnospiraceae bacterium]